MFVRFRGAARRGAYPDERIESVIVSVHPVSSTMCSAARRSGTPRTWTEPTERVSVSVCLVSPNSFSVWCGASQWYIAYLDKPIKSEWYIAYLDKLIKENRKDSRQGEWHAKLAQAQSSDPTAATVKGGYKLFGKPSTGISMLYGLKDMCASVTLYGCVHTGDAVTMASPNRIHPWA
eukprot:1519560-Pyramimonas_sp.AAC.1